MAANNYDELTRKCQEIFDKLILENKDEIEKLNKEPKKVTRHRSMAPPNSYGLYGSSRRQCDIECTIIRPRSNSVPASFLSEYNAKIPEMHSLNNNLTLAKPTFEPIQEEGEFKISERPKYNYTVSTDPVLNAELRKISSKMDTHCRSKSLSAISETGVLNIENLINNKKEDDENEIKEKKSGPKPYRSRSLSYSYGNPYLNKSPLDADEYKKRVELEVYRQQLKCYEKFECKNLERNKYQKFLKWQESDYQNKKNSWNI